MLNLTSTLLAQYANSPILQAVLENWNASIDPSAAITAWYNDVWNIKTAKGFGLDTWGKIVGIARPNLPAPTAYLGFGNSASGWYPFGQAPLWNSGSQDYYALDDGHYRTLIMIKAAANINGCSAQVVNQMLQALFGDLGNSYVVDAGNMAMRLVFEFALDQWNLDLLTTTGAFSRPAGVQAYILSGWDSAGSFGFAGSGLQTFGHGTFFKGSDTPVTV